jgi:predicted lipid-binding transport protein (Tim44 family)
VNRAWSAGDITTLARITTPEMTQYFRDDYAALAARGWKNETSDVTLESGDVAEAWNEGARDYCTVAMRFSLVDVTRSLADGAVVEGHPSNRQMVTETWTFVRVQGGLWQVSAIQQNS